jgi:hypothetical protein
MEIVPPAVVAVGVGVADGRGVGVLDGVEVGRTVGVRVDVGVDRAVGVRVAVAVVVEKMSEHGPESSAAWSWSQCHRCARSSNGVSRL